MELWYVRDKEEYKREDGILSIRILKLKEVIGIKFVVVRVGWCFFVRIIFVLIVVVVWRVWYLLL